MVQGTPSPPPETHRLDYLGGFGSIKVCECFSVGDVTWWLGCSCFELVGFVGRCR